MASDDIVTRLRGELVVRLNGEPWMTFDALPVFHQAADEIERLRAENHGLKVRIFTLINKIESLVVRGE